MSHQKNNLLVGMTVFGSIFFIFGFATTFIIQLSSPVRAVFNLTEFQAQLLTSAFFIAYPVMSVPTGLLVNRIGYKWTISAGLLLMSIGSMIFIPAAQTPSYPLFLLATFILATGVVFLQVAANPYVTALGPESLASSRLNLAPGFEFYCYHDSPLAYSSTDIQRIRTSNRCYSSSGTSFWIRGSNPYPPAIHCNGFCSSPCSSFGLCDKASGFIYR